MAQEGKEGKLSEEIERWRVRNATVEAVQWTGENIDAVRTLTGVTNFDAVDEEDRANSDDPDCTGQLLTTTHSTWVGVEPGEWIVKNVTGGLFRISDEQFRVGYEPAPASTTAGGQQAISRNALEQLAATWRGRYREYADASIAPQSLDDARAQRAIGVAYKKCAEQLESALAAEPVDEEARRPVTPVVIVFDPRECSMDWLEKLASAVREQSGGKVIITDVDAQMSDAMIAVADREVSYDEAAAIWHGEDEDDEQ